MGGAPAASNKKNNVRVKNTSKNSKVQAVAFDFELLVKAIHEQQAETQQQQQQQQPEKHPEHSVNSSGSGSSISNKNNDVTMKTSARTPATSSSSSVLKPNVDQVQEVANLLKVDLNNSNHAIGDRRKSLSYKDDDLSALIGKAINCDDDDRTNGNETTRSSSSSRLEDIRAKYADKLHKRGVEGGVAGVELVKHQREEALKRGDAEGHWAARKIAVSTRAPAGGGTRWMALTGTGKLLSTLTHRSMKIALLPRLSSSSNKNSSKMQQQQQQQQQGRTPYGRMQDLTRQLKDVVFDVLVDLPQTQTPAPNPTGGACHENNEGAAEIIVQTTLEKLSLDPQVILFVSDQDSFLRQAKQLGMITCRIRPLNARRGNVSAHYTVETVLQVHDVVNELCGISFNAVLNL